MHSTRTPAAPADRVADDGPTDGWGSSRLLAAVGGAKGVVDGGLPPLVFVVANAVAASAWTRPVALLVAAGAATATALTLVVLRLVRREPLRQTLPGLVGIAIAVVFAARAGEARAYFLPGIWVDAAYAVVFAGSAAVGRPLAGTIHGVVSGQRGHWRTDPRLRRSFLIVTLGWSAVFATRAAVQAVLYLDDRPGLLAAGKLLLGWPLTVLALFASLAYLRRVWPGTLATSGTPSGAAPASTA